MIPHRPNLYTNQWNPYYNTKLSDITYTHARFRFERVEMGGMERCNRKLKVKFAKINKSNRINKINKKIITI